MRPVIEFATEAEMEEARRLLPVTKPRTKRAYDDLILKPEYQSRRFTFPLGKTCIRILPPIKGGAEWEHEIHVFRHPDGQHLHPKSLIPKAEIKAKPKAKSVFETAYGWLRTHKPDLLFSKTNRDGYRLLSTKMAVCWILVEIDGEMEAKLLLGATYDGGSQGGNCGIAHQLKQVANELSQPGGHDAVDAKHGVQIIVEKTIADGSKYPIYKMTRNHMAAPVERYLERMQDAELAALCPLHQVLRSVAPDEEWELLAKVVGEELRDEIRNATAKHQPPSPPKPEPVLRETDEPSAVSEGQSNADDAPSDAGDDKWIW